MRCTSHPRPPGSVGVCPSCLRERLLAVIEAQAGEDRRKSDVLPPPPPPPLIFPRSVSPYICRRSDATHCQNHFYSTPQVGPTFKKEETKKEKKGRFAFISYLFGGSRSVEVDRDRRVSKAPIAPSSWFSAIRKKKSRLFSLDDEIHGGRRSIPARDRGMSPEREEEEREDGYSTGQWYSCESSPGWRKSVSEAAAPGPTRRGSQHARNVSGFAVCLSPLVRASPNRRQRAEPGFSAELRRANRHHLSTAASLCPSRSRKLADFGRYP